MLDMLKQDLNNYLKCLIWDNPYLNQDLQSLNLDIPNFNLDIPNLNQGLKLDIPKFKQYLTCLM